MYKRTQESGTPPWIPPWTPAPRQEAWGGGVGAKAEGARAVPTGRVGPLTHPGTSCFAQGFLLCTPSTPRLVTRENYRPGRGPLRRREGVGEERGRRKKGPTPGVEPSVHLYIFREDRVGVGYRCRRRVGQW